MKRKIVVEIDYPDGFDDQWDNDCSGLQAFHDTVIFNASAGSVELLCMALEESMKNGFKTGEHSNDPRVVCNKVVASLKTYGYVDDNNVIHQYDKLTGNFD